MTYLYSFFNSKKMNIAKKINKNVTNKMSIFWQLQKTNIFVKQNVAVIWERNKICKTHDRHRYSRVSQSFSLFNFNFFLRFQLKIDYLKTKCSLAIYLCFKRL